jgi:hypothetical protein
MNSLLIFRVYSTYTEQYPTSEILLPFMPFYFLYEEQVMKNLVLISCNDSACTRMKYIFFTDSRSSKVVPKGAQRKFSTQKLFLRECKTKINEVTKFVPKGAQRNFSAQKSFLRECRAKIDQATKVIPKGAQCMFSAQKSFQRECRAKYRRNIRQRSSNVVPKGMQNLYH